jgi:hypothetical protein
MYVRSLIWACLPSVQPNQHTIYTAFRGRGDLATLYSTEHDLCKNLGDIDACTDFEMLKVKVPIIFLGTAGFSLRREGR